MNPDIQHIGSTSINSIKAKPIINIAVAVNDYDEVIARNDKLAKYDIVFRFDERPEQLLYVKGDFEASLISLKIEAHMLYFLWQCVANLHNLIWT